MFVYYCVLFVSFIIIMWINLTFCYIVLIQLLILFINSYFQYQDKFYKQTTGGPRGSPLTVALAEIRVTETEQLALETASQPPKHYRHFVDDGFGHFTDKQHANEFLQHINGLTNDLQYTIEHPTPDGSITNLDVLIHADKTTSVYRKPTYTNLYTHYSSSTPQSSKDSVISSLTRRVHTICSPSHIEPEIQHIKQTLLSNGYPLTRINLIMVRTLKNLKKKKNPPKLKTSPSANILLLYPAGYHKDIKSTLQRYDISTTFSSSTTLMSLPNTNKAPTPKSNTMNTINKIPRKDCDD